MICWGPSNIIVQKGTGLSHPPSILPSICICILMVHGLFMFFKSSSPPFIISTILALLLVIEKSLCVDPYFKTCSLSRTCGGLNIGFPFYIEGLQDPLCGYLGFNVSCLHNTTILTISENPYIIHQIFYQNQTLRVSNALGNGCLPLGRDLLLPNEEFELAHPDGTDFFFFLSNCSAPLPDNLVRYKINCSGDDGASPVLAMSKGDSNLVLASEKCGREVKAPFEEKADDGSDEIGEELVRRGFMLKWKASDCSVCEGSGGKCGYNISDYHFKCFCPDRPHAKHCVSSKFPSLYFLSINWPKNDCNISFHRPYPYPHPHPHPHLYQRQFHIMVNYRR